MRGVVAAVLLMASSTWVMADEVKCLAKNIYWEARNQSVEGMYAVADVTLNRVKDSRWPSTICAVVEQRKRDQRRGKWICQFSWFCDGLSDEPKSRAVYNLCYMIAYLRFNNLDSVMLPNNIYWYHNNKVSPYWASAYSHKVTIGDHLFYSDR